MLFSIGMKQTRGKISAVSVSPRRINICHYPTPVEGETQQMSFPRRDWAPVFVIRDSFIWLIGGTRSCVSVSSTLHIAQFSTESMKPPLLFSMRLTRKFRLYCYCSIVVGGFVPLLLLRQEYCDVLSFVSLSSMQCDHLTALYSLLVTRHKSLDCLLVWSSPLCHHVTQDTAPP